MRRCDKHDYDSYLVMPSLQEWLETDGLGGFCSTTTAGINTRRYHGWLFLTGTAGDRFLALSNLDDRIVTQDGTYDLSTSFYPGVLHPKGASSLWSFSARPVPTSLYKIGDRLLAREVFVEKGVPGVFCKYTLLDGTSGEDVRLLARPLCNYRNYHHTTRAGSWEPKVYSAVGSCVLEGHPCGTLALLFAGASFTQGPVWYRNMVYPLEADRGLDDKDDHFSPGEFSVVISRDSPGYFWAGPLPTDAAAEDLSRSLPARCEDALRSEKNRRAGIGGILVSQELKELALAGDQFVIEQKGQTSIIAGYHWFGEWGRDTFIALPGLLLHTGRFDEARRVFTRFCDEMKGGLIPNVLSEGRSSYNSVDGSLWMIHALGEYERLARDSSFPLLLLSRLREILDTYILGQVPGITVTSDGLVKAGDEKSQITWMDACAGDRPVTPRQGLPVEIQALWLCALENVARWTELMSESGTRFRNLYEKGAVAFIRDFIWPGVGLYDRVDNQGSVKEIRPNAVIAASLLGRHLPGETLAQVWNTAARRLLTPRGLRTLDPAHPCYKGTYAGGPYERDLAYHQGTAWPYLLGVLYDVASLLDGRGDGKPVELSYSPRRDTVLRALLGVTDLQQNPCLGTIFEVASGDFPYKPGGAVAQAWSVAEVYRILALEESERSKTK